MIRNTKQVSNKVATVMPEIGLDDEPTSPVNRDDTVTKRNPNSRIMTAPRMPPRLSPSPSWGTAARRPQVAQAGQDGGDDQRQRPAHADDAARCHRPGTDVAQVELVDVAG